MDINRAYKLYIMIIIHIVVLVITILFNIIIYKRAKKNLTLKNFIILQSIIGIWLISKILKAISPTVTLRFISVVIQYLAIAFIGYFFINFSYVFYKDKPLNKIIKCLLLIYPITTIIAVITNPLHMKFFKYFTLFKLHFGKLFYIHGYFNYTYIFIAISILIIATIKYRKQYNVKVMILLLIAPVFPMIINVLYFYRIFRMFFDLTPITFSISNIIYAYAIFRYNFLEVPKVAADKVVNNLEHGIVLIDEHNNLIIQNLTARKIFGCETYNINKLMEEGAKGEFSIGNKFYKGTKKTLSNNRDILYRINNITDYRNEILKIEQKNAKLIKINEELRKEVDNRRKLIETKEKIIVARELHDDIGHYLTTVLHMMEIMLYLEDETQKEKYIGEIRKYVEHTRISLEKDNYDTTKKIYLDELKADIGKLAHNYKSIGIDVKVILRGEKSKKIDNKIYLNLYRICQEALTNALKHGHPKTVNIFIMDKEDNIEIYIIDDGIGCEHVNEGNGLNSIKDRVRYIGGEFNYGSSTNEGFNIYIKVPEEYKTTNAKVTKVTFADSIL